MWLANLPHMGNRNSVNKDIVSSMTEKKMEKPARWLRVDGSTVSCTESVKILDENWEEMRTMLQEMYEDAILLGCGKERYRAELHQLVDALSCDYKEKQAPVESKSTTE